MAYEDIVKGYELTKERYVVITPDELEALDPEKSRTIDIEDFVDLADIDPVYYDHPYYLVPDKGAAKAYGLLLRAMRESGKVAIARVVLRSKEQLVAIRPAPGDVLMMETMIFADEVVPPDEIDDLPVDEDLKASERELKMAQQLIDSLSSDFEPDKYRDEYREKVLELIERKAAGRGDRRPARGAGADQGARPHGRARGEPRRGQGRRRRRQGGRRREEGRRRPPRRAQARPPPRPRSGRLAVELEPDARLRVALDAPAVRQLAHEVEPPAGRPRRVRGRARQLEARGRGRRPRSAARSLGHDDEADHVRRAEARVPDRVRDQLGDEQPGVLEPPRREVVGHLLDGAPRLGGGVGVAREVDLVPHAAPVTSPGRRRTPAAPACA